MAKQFTLAEAATLADTPVVTVRSWFGSTGDRSAALFALAAEDQSAPAGGTRYISPNTLLAVCIAAELTRLSIPIRRAAGAGLKFAITASGHPQRQYPGALYYHHPDGAWTYMALRPDGVTQIFPVKPNEPQIELLAWIGAGAAILHIDPIVHRIEQAVRDKEQPRDPAESSPGGHAGGAGRHVSKAGHPND